MNHTMTNPEDPLTWSNIVARGTESEQFLQGQLSNDVSHVPAEGLWALILAPDSVVVTSCLVTTLDDGFSLTVPRSLGETALARLRRFLLRTKCTVELFDSDDGPFETTAQLIEAGAPGPREFAAQLTPHSFGATFVEATISFTKGCFTGQELVGRLDARGSSVPWRLVRASGPSVELIDEVIASKGPQGPQGVTTWVADGATVRSLAIAHRTLLGPERFATTNGVSLEAIA